MFDPETMSMSRSRSGTLRRSEAEAAAQEEAEKQRLIAEAPPLLTFIKKAEGYSSGQSWGQTMRDWYKGILLKAEQKR